MIAEVFVMAIPIVCKNLVLSLHSKVGEEGLSTAMCEIMGRKCLSISMCNNINVLSYEKYHKI